MGQVWGASGNKECAAFSSLPGKSRKKLTHKASLKKRLQEEISFSKVKGMERAEWELAGLFLMSVSKLSTWIPSIVIKRPRSQSARLLRAG